MTMPDIENIEHERLALQGLRDGTKSQVQRNRLGQFATPTALARDILRCANQMLASKRGIRFLDPALGTGSFYSAFLSIFGQDTASRATGFEIDEHYGRVADVLWRERGLSVRHEDFTRAQPPDDEAQKATLVICNPPYVRHHHLVSEEKERLKDVVSTRYGVSLSGLSGLYCYFLCLSKDWMAQSGLAAWLVPSEFMDVNYGRAIKEFLLTQVSLLRIHRFLPDDVQFDDALVSSAVVWFKNEKPREGQRVVFSLGGSVTRPFSEMEYSVEELRQQRKWTSLPRPRGVTGTDMESSGFALGSFFDVKRGIATGANEFFILSRSDVERRKIPCEFLTPILPSPRFLKTDRIESDQDGIPCIDRVRFLFSSDIAEERIRQDFPSVWDYLEEGRAQGICERYICRNRYPWYAQERREAAPLLCTYMGRGNGNGGTRPFRFILNQSRAIAANVYLMLYPKPWLKKTLQRDAELMERVWNVLQSIPVESLLGEGRVYGGGLHKLEPKELLNTPADALADLFPGSAKPHTQMCLF